MNLYLLRHGPAGEHGSVSPDSERPLTKDGRKVVRCVAKTIKKLDLDLDLVLSSPYLRALQTAEIVVETCRIEKALKISPTLASDGNPKELIDELKGKYHRKKAVLLVGHEPYLSRLISLLISGDTRAAINFKKAGFCKLCIDGLRYGRCAQLEWLLTPSQME